LRSMVTFPPPLRILVYLRRNSLTANGQNFKLYYYRCLDGFTNQLL
jgi:hypothetical protein